VALDDPDFDPELLLLEEPELAVIEDVESLCDADCEDEPESVSKIED